MPAVYSLAATTPLDATVVPGGENEFEFDLKDQTPDKTSIPRQPAASSPSSLSGSDDGWEWLITDRQFRPHNDPKETS